MRVHCWQIHRVWSGHSTPGLAPSESLGIPTCTFQCGDTQICKHLPLFLRLYLSCVHSGRFFFFFFFFFAKVHFWRMKERAVGKSAFVQWNKPEQNHLSHVFKGPHVWSLHWSLATTLCYYCVNLHSVKPCIEAAAYVQFSTFLVRLLFKRGLYVLCWACKIRKGGMQLFAICSAKSVALRMSQNCFQWKQTVERAKCFAFCVQKENSMGNVVQVQNVLEDNRGRSKWVVWTTPNLLSCFQFSSPLDCDKGAYMYCSST